MEADCARYVSFSVLFWLSGVEDGDGAGAHEAGEITDGDHLIRYHTTVIALFTPKKKVAATR